MDKISKLTLAWINETRAELEIGPPLESLPQGKQRSSHFCPVARALSPANATTVYVGVWRNGKRFTIMVPDFVADFIVRFDRNRYPELVER